MFMYDMDWLRPDLSWKTSHHGIPVTTAVR